MIFAGYKCSNSSLSELNSVVEPKSVSHTSIFYSIEDELNLLDLLDEYKSSKLCGLYPNDKGKLFGKKLQDHLSIIQGLMYVCLYVCPVDSLKTVCQKVVIFGR